MPSTSGSPQASRGSGGRRRQGFAAEKAQAGAGAKPQAGGPAPALRPLEELRAEWLRHRAQTSAATAEDSSQRRRGAPARGGVEGSDARQNAEPGAAQSRKGYSGSRGTAAAAGPRPNASEERRSKALHRSEDGPVDPAPVASEAGAGRLGDRPDHAEAKDTFGAVLDRKALLCMRPRPGSCAPAKLPKVLAIPREAHASPVRSEAPREKDGPSIPGSDKPSADPFMDSAFEFEDARGGDDDAPEEQQPGGVEKSRGFSKWFGFSRKSTGSADGGLTVEIGVLTDAGTCTGVDESSTEEEAELQLTDSGAGAPGGNARLVT